MAIENAVVYIDQFNTFLMTMIAFLWYQKGYYNYKIIRKKSL